jgi:hypothetical protein
MCEENSDDEAKNFPCGDASTASPNRLIILPHRRKTRQVNTREPTSYAEAHGVKRALDLIKMENDAQAHSLSHAPKTGGASEMLGLPLDEFDNRQMQDRQDPGGLFRVIENRRAHLHQEPMVSGHRLSTL